MKLHDKVKLFYKLAMYGDRAAFLNSLAQSWKANTGLPTPSLSPQQQDPNAALHEMMNPKIPAVGPNMQWTTMGVLPKGDQQVQTLPEQTIKGYPAIPANTQDQLNKLLVPGGSMIPLKLDGELGPETAKAIKLFKDKYGKTPTVNSIKETYLAQQAHPELERQVPDMTASNVGEV